ncbi:MAG TPA: LPS assembly protein LptD [Gammaproteobacteria bacterium]|nr:LPS assembly protein LptD [Gammaproteobacteria bacterium]
MKRVLLAAVIILLAIAPAVNARDKHKRVVPQWDLCPYEAEPEGRPENPDLESGFLSLDADEGKFIKHGTSTLTGDVQMIRDDGAARADRAIYNDDKQTLDLYNHVRLWKDKLYWEGQHGFVDWSNQIGILDSGNYRLLELQGRGEAKVIETDLDKKLSKLKEATYTTCPGDIPDWKLSAKKITLDHNEEWGNANDVVLRVHDIPVMYLPYTSFPLSKKRKSGFLTPSIGQSGASGTSVKIPYYWNIAPNADATFTPQILAKRGALLGGEVRYLSPTSMSSVDGDFLPYDNERNGDERHLIHVLHTQSLFNSRGALSVDFSDVSDSKYFEDFGNSLSVSSTSFLERQALLSYSGGWWSMSGLLNGYQTVDPTLPASSRPYSELPQITLSAGRGANRSLTYGVTTQATYFNRDNSVNGGRFNFEPYVSYPIRNAGSFFIPRLALDQTYYTLSGNTDNHISRTVPVFSLDNGLYFERDVTLGPKTFTHTLEPRLFYLYRPKVDQNDIPVFDSGLFDVSFAELFYTNRFSGYDRLGDENSVTAAITSRLLDSQDGSEWLRGSIGQIYHFTDRVVTLPGAPKQTDPVSEIVAELSARLSSHWTAGGTLGWDPNDNVFDKSAIRLRYRGDSNQILNLDYRFVDATRNALTSDINQTDVSLRWPLGRQWSVLSRWNYSIPDNKTLEIVGGLEYESCCWGIRTVARHFLRTSTGTYDTGVFVELELKGLAGTGGQALSLLRKEIPGYVNTF